MKKILLSLYAIALFVACESQSNKLDTRKELTVNIFVEDSIGSNLLIAINDTYPGDGSGIYPNPNSHEAYVLGSNIYSGDIRLIDTLKEGYKHELKITDSREHLLLNLIVEGQSLITESTIEFQECNFPKILSFDTIRCEINKQGINKIWVNQKISWIRDGTDAVPALHIIKPYPIAIIGGLPNPGEPGWPED
jgi:hypothetical protein